MDAEDRESILLDGSNICSTGFSGFCKISRDLSAG